MREMLNPTSAIAGMGLGSSVALITDGRFSGASLRCVHRSCKPGGSRGRPIALVEEGDLIRINIPEHKLEGCRIGRRAGTQKSCMDSRRTKGNDRLSETLRKDGFQCK